MVTLNMSDHGLTMAYVMLQSPQALHAFIYLPQPIHRILSRRIPQHPNCIVSQSDQDASLCRVHSSIYKNSGLTIV